LERVGVYRVRGEFGKRVLNKGMNGNIGEIMKGEE